MLYETINRRRPVPNAIGGLLGIGHGMQRVTKDPSFKAKPAPVRKANGAEPADDKGSALPDPAWNKDIRAYYEAVVEEPVPQEFIDLLTQIAKDITE